MGKTHLGEVVASEGFASSDTGVAMSIVGQASETWDAGSIADGNEEVGELTVTGAVLGDYALASHAVDVADLGITAAVTAADTVTYQLWNNTGGAIDLASATVKVLVIRAA
jgi:hypothetical protein